MAGKKEAKIKFIAETGSFDDAIKQSNNEMAKLRAELKLNETQMKATGSSVEILENKHKILSEQLAASEGKTEALSQKVNKAAEIFGENSTEVTKLKTQLLNAQAAEEKIRQAVNACNSELEEQRSAAEEAGSASEQLTSTISSQQSELNRLKRAYTDAVLCYGETSDEAQELAGEITDLSSDLKQNQNALNDASRKADELAESLDDAEGTAEEAGDGFTVLKGALADLASNAIQGVIGKLGELTSYLLELPSETLELRQDMATLSTSFDETGFSTETATNTWKDLYAVFGEDDRAVETANNISKIADNQKDLNNWVTITTGVWGTYQDSLPVESLAEAANETAKTGTVAGGLADALNWSSEAASLFSKYMNDDVVTAEDAFNVALSECSDEQERQQLITDTLTQLYGSAADTYRDTAGAQMEAKEAAAENILAENNLAAAIEPVTTKFTEMRTEMLQNLQPAIEVISDAAVSALDWMQEHPVAMQAISVAVGILAAGLTVLAGAALAYSVAQWAMNSAILANPVTWMVAAVIAAVAAITGIVVVIVSYWDEIKAAAQIAADTISTAWGNFTSWINTNVIQPIKQFFSGLWEGITEAASTAWDGIFAFFSSIPEWFSNNVIQPVISFFTGLWNSLQNIWNTICNVVQVAIMLIGSIISGAVQIITLPFQLIWENCKEYVFTAWEAIKSSVSIAIEAVQTTISTVMNIIQTTFTTVWEAIKLAFTTVWTAILDFVKPILSSIASAIRTAWNTVKNTTSTVFNTVKSVTTTVWNVIKTAVSTAVNAVKSVVTTVFNTVKSVVTTIFNGIKSTATSVWNGIKTIITNVVNGVKNTVTSVFNSVKSTITSVFNGIKSTATSVWNGIKTAIITPIEAAKDKVKSIVDTIKGFFSGMKLELPKIKLPHFKITGELSISPPSVPHLSIDWYKEGGILTRPTIFGVNGTNLMAGGEAGAEAILPIDRLEGYVSGAIERSMNVVDLDRLVAAVEDLANRPMQFSINGRNFMTATASDGDNVNGLRGVFKNRGLAIE